MIKITLLLIILLTSCYSKVCIDVTEFKYLDKVIVTKGFYEGHSGVVLSSMDYSGGCGAKYNIMLDGSVQKETWFGYDEIKLKEQSK